MGASHWKPLPPDITGAARELAELLRSTLDREGLTLRRLAAEDDVPYSLTTLHRFFAGQSLPPRLLIKVISRKCGGDPEELQGAYDRAREAAAAARRARRSAGTVADETSKATQHIPTERAPRAERVSRISPWPTRRPRRRADAAKLSVSERPMLASAAFAVSTVGGLMLVTALVLGLGGDAADDEVRAQPVVGAPTPSPSAPDPTPTGTAEPSPSKSPSKDPNKTSKPEPSARNVAHTEPDTNNAGAPKARGGHQGPGGQQKSEPRDRDDKRAPARPGPRVAAAGGQELIQNGTFSGTTAYWWNNGVGMRAAGNRLRISVPGGSGRPADKMVGYSIFPLRSGGSYALRFNAKADSRMTVVVTVQREYEPYTRALSRKITLGPSMRTFSYQFGSGFTTDRGVITVQVGGHGGHHTVWLDNVSLVRLG